MLRRLFARIVRQWETIVLGAIQVETIKAGCRASQFFLRRGVAWLNQRLYFHWLRFSTEVSNRRQRAIDNGAENEDDSSTDSD